MTTLVDDGKPETSVSRCGLEVSMTARNGTETYEYDEQGRRVSVSSFAAGATSPRSREVMRYNVFGDLVETVTDLGADGSATATAVYDLFGREVARTDALGNTAMTEYDGLGRAVSTSGDAYPIQTCYDSMGRKTRGATTRDGGNTWDETGWTYDPASGLNTAKRYADGSQIAYAYTDNGKKTRTTWARGVWKENAYDSDNRVSGVTYSDGTPTVQYAYNAAGKVAAAATAEGAQFGYAYDERLLCTNETFGIGPDCFEVARDYDANRRAVRTSVIVTNVAYAVKSRWFDSENRVAGYALTNSLGRGVTATLAYDGSRMSGMTFSLPNGGTFSSALTRSASRPDLITRRAYSENGRSIYSYDTSFDLLGRPVNATDSQSLARSYLYNGRSELAAATIGTNAFEYAYDTIGNRTVASANSVTNTYAANALNQYTQIDASLLAYDNDGNLTRDDRFVYAYDAENRLVSVHPISPTEGALAVINIYDHDNRRAVKRVDRFDGSAWQISETHTFVYDGNNFVLERVAFADGSSRTVEYFWGNDLSGSEQGAGGVGGLLAVSIDGMFYFPCYDQNGNVVCYMFESGTIAAQYVYDPYGNVIDQYGNMPDQFAFGFSTKYLDRETGLIGYQRRFYRPEHGRWLNRDPIEEDGGENLYAFCFANPILFCDSDGAFVITGPIADPSAPHSWDQLGGGEGPFDEEQWFEGRYGNLLAEARRRFTKQINDGIDCSKGVFDGKSKRMKVDPGAAGDWPWQDCVGGNDSEFGDAGQSSWEAVAVLGKFAIDFVTPVYISYTCEKGKLVYHWTTTMYVEDALGLQGDEGWLGKYFGWAAKSRRVKRAQWPLSGSGICK